MRHLSNIIALSLLFGGNAMMAQEVSIDVAKSRTLDFLSRQSIGPKFAKGTTSSTDLNLAYTSKSEAKTCFYVFNVGDDNGFVIAGGDEAALEILGYCDHGSFDYDTANPAFKWWLDQYTEQIAHADAPSEEALAAAAAYRAKAAQTRVTIGPLIKTKWDQHEPYNNEIPIYDDSGEPYLTGCVATAMAQVMKYWKYPTHGTGSYSYTPTTYKFSADFGNTTYDWGNMRDTYLYNEESGGPLFTEAEAKAVGTLMYHAGVSVHMGYGIEESGAYHDSIGTALIKYFGYDKSIQYEERQYYSNDEWGDIIYSELDNSRPILYYGGRHMFVCDGYDNEKDLFSFNWGWGGEDDGYFSLSASGFMSSLLRYGGILTNVMPDRDGTEVPHLAQYAPNGQEGYNAIFLSADFLDFEKPEDHLDFCRNNEYERYCLFTNLWNFSALTTHFDLGVKAIETTSGKEYYWLSESDVSLEIGERIKNSNESYMYYEEDTIFNAYVSNSDFYPFGFDFRDLNYGTYELRPLYRKHGDTEWQEVQLLPWETFPTITIPGGITFAKEPYFNNGNNIYLDDMVLHYTLVNKYDYEATGSIFYYIQTAIRNYYLEGALVEDITIGANEEYEGEFDLRSLFWGEDEELVNEEISNLFSPGKEYFMGFYIDPDLIYGIDVCPYLYFKRCPKLEVNYVVSPSGFGTLILPFDWDVPYDMKVYSCEGVDYNNVLTLKECENEIFDRNVPYIVLGDPDDEYYFEGPEAIEGDSYQAGLLIGAVSDNVPLEIGTDYILQEQGGKVAFYRYMGNPEGRKATQFRAFLRLPNESSSQAPKINFPGNGDDETEGISTLSTDTLPTGIYTLAGHRQTTLQKGLNILILDDGTTQKIFVK